MALPSPQPAPITHARPPKVLANGPYWARLSDLRTSVHPAASQSSDNTITSVTNAASAPPIVLPDRVGTTRLLLQDTQACIQKFAARMDALGTRVEQALTEVQLARAALDTAGEKTVAELADLVYKCQASLTKSIEAQGATLEKTGEKIVQLAATNESLFKLYDAHSASMHSLTQTSHTHAGALQTLQTQQCQLLTALAPLEPLIKAVPLHFDTKQNALFTSIASAIRPAVEKAVENGIVQFFAKNADVASCAHAHPDTTTASSLGLPKLARGKKRKRTVDDGPAADAPRPHPNLHRPSTVATTHIDSDAGSGSSSSSGSGASEYREPSSPLALRRRSGLWTAARLRSRGSIQRAPTEPEPEAGAPESSGAYEATKPSLPLSRKLSARRPTFSVADSSGRQPASRVSGRTRSRSVAHITGPDASTDVDVGAGMDIDVLSSGATLISHANAGPVRVTRASAASTLAVATTSMAWASAHLQSASPSFTDLRASVGLSVDQPVLQGGVTEAGTVVMESGPLVDSKKTVGGKSKSTKTKTKTKTKTTKAKASGSRCRKGKKTTGAPPLTQGPDDADAQKAIALSDSGSYGNTKVTTTKRTTTGASDATETSAAAERGPPNSPSLGAPSAGSMLADIDAAANVNEEAALPIATAAEEKAEGLPGLIGHNAGTNVAAPPKLKPAQQIPVSTASGSAQTRPEALSLSLIDIDVGGSAENDVSAPGTEGGWAGTDARLAAALEHVHSDIDFAGPRAYGWGSDVGYVAGVNNEHDRRRRADGLDDIGVFHLPQTSAAYDQNYGTLYNQSNSRSRRLLVDETSGIDLWPDELLDE